MSEKTIPIAAISRLTRKPSSRNLKLFPVDHPFPVVGVEEVFHALIA